MLFRSMFDSIRSRSGVAGLRATPERDYLPSPGCRPQFEALERRRLLSGSPAISISDVSLVEGDGGATACTFTVSLSKPTSRRVFVNFATADGSAVAGGDYVKTSGTLTFARGQTTRTVTVFASGDTAYEPDETFFVTLSRARNASIADARGTGTIFNDDAAPPPVQDWPLPPQPEGDCNDGPYGCQ